MRRPGWLHHGTKGPMVGVVVAIGGDRWLSLAFKLEQLAKQRQSEAFNSLATSQMNGSRASQSSSDQP